MAWYMDGGISTYRNNLSQIEVGNYWNNKDKLFIENNQTWNISKLNIILPTHIVNKIITITFPTMIFMKKLFENSPQIKNFCKKNI